MISNPYELALHLGAPDAIAAEVQRILDADTETGWREVWVERLNDPWWLEHCADEIPRYLDPETLERIIAGRLERMDPFHPDNLRIDAFLAAVDAGATVISEEIETGEITAVTHYPGSREGAKHTN